MAGNSAPLQLFGDFGFVGGEDAAPNPLQNAQTCINWYAEVDKQNAKEVVGLLGCPGLIQLVAPVGGGVPQAIGGPGSTQFETLLMHFDGTNGAASFIDVHGHAFANSPGGGGSTSALSTAQAQFGPSSLGTNAGSIGTTGGNIAIADLAIHNQDFTWECWFYATSGGVIQRLISWQNDGNGSLALRIDASNHLSAFFTTIANATVFSITGTTTVTLNTWHHAAVDRRGSTAWLWLDGGLEATTNSASGDIGQPSEPFSISGYNHGGNFFEPFHGYIDEVRVVIGQAMYTAPFTPRGPFPFTTPGLITQWALPSTITNLPVRGTWELPNDNTALAVIGSTCYLVTVATPAIGYPPTFPTLALTSVGTLLTSTGPVSIRDNDVGGFAVIVDGPYGYLYNIATQAFAQITDPAFLGADTVAFIDGWWVFNQYSTSGTQVFYTNGAQYSTGFNASFFALKDGAADNLRAVFENKEQLWLLGDKTTEVWYDAGGQYFAFQRLVGTLMQFGCKAAHSVARFSTEGQDGVILFGRSERGENTIIKTRGFSFDVVSTPAFSAEVAQYPVTSDAIAYTYQEDTHEFYVLIFPTADTTWCYDAQSGLLHKRLSYDPYLQKFHRHRSNCFMNFQGMRIVGDYQCGSLYQLTRNVQTDANWPILARRRSPHIWDKSQRGRTFMVSLQVDFRVGLAPASGLGSNPQAKLRISRDGGITFGQQWPSPMGQIGQYKTRTMWRKLGFGRDNVVELEMIDPVPRDIIGVTLKAFSA